MSKSQQNYLDQVAQRLHLTADAQSGILFGMQGGLHMMLMRSTSNQNFVSLVFFPDSQRTGAGCGGNQGFCQEQQADCKLLHSPQPGGIYPEAPIRQL